jgi:hypothetical protein
MRLTGSVRVGRARYLPLYAWADAYRGTVQREPLTSIQSRIFTTVHVTSGCGQLRRIAANLANTVIQGVNPMKVHVNVHVHRHGHLGLEFIPIMAGRMPPRLPGARYSTACVAS